MTAQVKAGSVVVLTAAADVNKLIDSIQKRGLALQADCHRAAVAALYHADKHGDVTLMQRLLTALPDMARRNALIAWAITFGKFKASEDGKSVDYNKVQQTDLDAGATTPFWEFKPEKPFTAFDLGAEIEKLIKRAEKAAKDERNSLPAEGFRSLRELAAKIKPGTVDAKATAADPLALAS